jgi:hypothetical protein
LGNSAIGQQTEKQANVLLIFLMVLACFQSVALKDKIPLICRLPDRSQPASRPGKREILVRMSKKKQGFEFDERRTSSQV